MSIEAIISRTIFTLEDWRQYFADRSPAEQFCQMLIPLFTYIFNIFEQIPKNNLNIDFKKMIADELIKQFSPIISPICIMEMHSLRDRNILLGKSSEERFQDFIGIISIPEHALSLIKKYSKLGDLIWGIAQQYINNISTIIARFQRDQLLISNKFFERKFLYLTKIKSLGDRHRQGQSVSLLELNDVHNNEKYSLIYKPRPLQSDSAYYQFIQWLNLKCQCQHFIPQFINKNKYGWYQFIDYRGCHSPEGINRFYYRLGSLLAICYLLLGYDIHMENVIAHGEFPVIIDLECLLRPHLADEKTQYFQPYFSVSDTLIVNG